MKRMGAVIGGVVVTFFCFSIVTIYLYCRWDYHIAEFYFDQLCNDDEMYGIDVFQSVSLDDSYFYDPPKAPDTYSEYNYFYINNDLQIIENKFNESFEFVYMEKTKFSPIGPINQYRSYVIRKSDNKILGESRTFENGTGWFNNALIIGGGGPAEYCHPGQDDKGYWYSTLPHIKLIRNIFVMRLDQ